MPTRGLTHLLTWLEVRMDAKALKRWLDKALKGAADPQKAAGMEAYMKGIQPYLGVTAPVIKPLEREAARLFVPTTPEEYRTGVRTVFAGRYREYRHVAMELAQRWKPFIGPPMVPLYEEMIRAGAWWDVVDEMAARLVGKVYLDHRKAMEPVLEKWISDDDMWIRRTVLLSQLKHKKHTDAARLFRWCLALAHEKEFFIRKAIGWTLREYARTDPAAVRSFVRKNAEALSPLSVREATKHL